MQILEGKIEGPFAVEEDSELVGMITVAAVVRSGSTLMVRGMITGNLTVEKGGEVIVRGMVNGTIRNFGKVTVYGSIDAIQNCAPDCETVIAPGAQIKGRWP